MAIKNYDLSVVITARNEEFLSRTVEGVLETRKGNTEVIVVMDGGWANPPLKDHPDVTIIYHKESIGQRSAINEAVKLSRAKYIMKLDAHCIMDEGFDVKLMADYKPDWIVIPAQYNLHAFNWKCKKCGNEWYQGQTPTHCQKPGEGRGENKNCDSKEFERVMVWKPRFNRRSEFWRFDSDLHFQYWSSFKKRAEAQGDIAPTLSCLGACWFLSRERYWEIGGLEEEWGSWGQMGTELGCKSWLSGGAMMVNKKTWFAHMFRTQGGDFGFPYPQSSSQVAHARKRSREFFKEGGWSKAIHDIDWLINKFAPVPGWENKEKGIIFYTDNQLKLKIAHNVQKQLKSIGLPIVSSSLKKMDFGDKNIHLKLERSYLTMFKQILSALKALDTKYVFFCEHDILYHHSHFEFTPKKDDVWYYNNNVIKVEMGTGRTLKVNDCKQVSGICVNRKTAIEHYTKRIEVIEKYIREHGEKDLNSFIRKIGFEPGTHNRAERIDDSTCEVWNSEYPNIDIRHKGNLTPTRWEKDKFRNSRFTKGWIEGDISEIKGWDSKQLKFLKVD